MGPPKRGSPQYKAYLLRQCARKRKLRQTVAKDKMAAMETKIAKRVEHAVARQTANLQRTIGQLRQELDDEIRKKNRYMRSQQSAQDQALKQNCCCMPFLIESCYCHTRSTYNVFKTVTKVIHLYGLPPGFLLLFMIEIEQAKQAEIREREAKRSKKMMSDILHQETMPLRNKLQRTEASNALFTDELRRPSLIISLHS